MITFGQKFENTSYFWFYLQRLDQLLASRDVGDVDGGAESVQHLHLLEDVFPTRGADDQQLSTLKDEQFIYSRFCHLVWIYLLLSCWKDEKMNRKD